MHARRTKAFQPGHALSALVLVSRLAAHLRGGAEGRPELRDGLLGHRREPALQSARPAAGRQSAARPRRGAEGQGAQRQDRARARLHRRHRRDVHRLRQGRSPHPRAELSQGDGAGGAALSEGRRGADRLRDHAERRGFTRRQDLRQPAQGRGAARADLQAQAAASGRRALSHPPLRLSGDRGKRPRSRQALRHDRAGRAARAAHAVAHLHPRRLLEGVDQVERRIGARRQARRRDARSGARHGLSGLCAPATRRRTRRRAPWSTS